jgi:hypothetical protein
MLTIIPKNDYIDLSQPWCVLRETELGDYVYSTHQTKEDAYTVANLLWDTTGISHLVLSTDYLLEGNK